MTCKVTFGSPVTREAPAACAAAVRGRRDLVRDADEGARRVEQVDDQEGQDDRDPACLQRAGDVEGQQRRGRVGRQRGDALPLGDAEDETRDAQHPDEWGPRHPARRDGHNGAETEQGQHQPRRRQPALR